MVEPVEHVFRHGLFSFLQCRDGRSHGGDLTVDPLSLAAQPLEVVGQGGLRSGGPLEDLPDLRERGSEFAQQQDPLQPDERVGVVVAVAARADAGCRQQPHRAVVPQCAARRARELRDLADRPIVHDTHARS